MIPYLPPGTSDLEIPPFYRQIVENLKVRSGHHEVWHTHKRDTSVCWICDLVEISNLLINEIERVISKSALDLDDSLIVQDIGSEDGTDIFNVDEEKIDGISTDSQSVN